MALTLVSFVSIAIYGALWVLMPDTPVPPVPPGLQAADHQGMRHANRRQRRSNIGTITAVVMLVLGLAMLAQRLAGTTGLIFWPALLGAVGIALTDMKTCRIIRVHFFYICWTDKYTDIRWN